MDKNKYILIFGGIIMVRGVNKKIVEISETENKYFERAILFVRNDVSEKDLSVIKNQAEIYLNGITKEDKQNLNLNMEHKELPMWSRYLIVIAILFALTLIIFWIF